MASRLTIGNRIPSAKEAEMEANRLYMDIVRELGRLFPLDVDVDSVGYHTLGEKISEFGSARYWQGCGYADPVEP